MNAVGIDVSKGKSMAAALRPMGEVAMLPKEYPHTAVGLERLTCDILCLGENTRVVMEATGRYHDPVAAALHESGIYVSVLNPLYIKQSGGGSIRKVKTDKADAMKIAKYGLDSWVELREYTPMEAVRQQLKLCSRQYNLYMKTIVGLQNNLISLTDKTFPGVNELFKSPERADGHQKWVDFVLTFWHCDCVNMVSEKAFAERYQKWCKRKGYNFSQEKALDLYASSCGHFTTLPKNANKGMISRRHPGIVRRFQNIPHQRLGKRISDHDIARTPGQRQLNIGHQPDAGFDVLPYKQHVAFNPDFLPAQTVRPSKQHDPRPACWIIDRDIPLPLYLRTGCPKRDPAHHIGHIIWCKILAPSRIAQPFRHIESAKKILFRITGHIGSHDRQHLRNPLLLIPCIFLNNREVSILDFLFVMDAVVDCRCP